MQEEERERRREELRQTSEGTSEVLMVSHIAVRMSEFPTPGMFQQGPAGTLEVGSPNRCQSVLHLLETASHLLNASAWGVLPGAPCHHDSSLP